MLRPYVFQNRKWFLSQPCIEISRRNLACRCNSTFLNRYRRSTLPGSRFPTLWPPSWKSIWRNNSAVDRPITTKFGRQMQNYMPITMHWSKAKPEIEFQYGGRPCSESGSSFISAMDWDILSKFGMHIDFHLLKQMVSLNLKPGVDFRLYDRHFEKWIWRHDSAT